MVSYFKNKFSLFSEKTDELGKVIKKRAGPKLLLACESLLTKNTIDYGMVRKLIF